MTLSTQTASAAPDAALHRKAIFSSVIGNAFEWFDFLVYGFFTAAISKTFFPAENEFFSLLLTTASFAAGFVIRPLGGVILGLVADKYGRKPVLVLIIELMALASLVMALTPSYATIGIWAPILLIASRILQGLSVGGGFASATALIAEYAPPGKKMFYSSLQMCSQAFAIAFAAAFACGIETVLSPDQVTSWGWRLPFALGVLIGPLGFYIMKRVNESPEFAKIKAAPKPERSPLGTVLRDHYPAVLSSLGAVIVGTVSNYVWFIYLPMYVSHSLHLVPTDGLLSAAFCAVLLFFLCPLTGALADRFGAKRIFLIGTVLFGLMAYPLLHFVVADPSLTRLLIAQIACTLAISMIWGPTPGLLAENFPVSIRSTGMSISYNFGVLLFGGLAPFTLTWLIGTTGNSEVPAFYTIFAVILGVATQFVAQLRHRGHSA